MVEPLLIVERVSRRFGGLLAVDAASLIAPEGRITALIGPNGAGKTTLFAIISGFLKASDGSVSYAGVDITGERPHRLARRGIARTFQIVQPFAGLTVRENILVGAHLHHRAREAALAVAERVAREVGLAGMLDRPADTLTVAGRKRLELARALATEPKLLLLDEVLAGLNPSEIRDIVPVIRGLCARGITIVMIEHVMQAVMSLAERVFVLAEGRIIAEGTPAQVAADPTVVEAYLGHGAAVKLGGAHDESDVQAANSARSLPPCGGGLGRGVTVEDDRAQALTPTPDPSPQGGGERVVPGAMPQPILTVHDLHAGYGETEVLRGVDLAVATGEIVAVLGSNGVGKSTLNLAISGIVRPRAGAIRFDGAEVGHEKPPAIVARGLIHVPEGRRIFPNLSVGENLDLGSYRRARGHRARNRERVFAIFPRLYERRGQRAGTLSGGEQQMLAIGRGLMAEPKLIILDEPSLGLSPLLVEELFALIKRINGDGVSILLVEQNVVQSLEVADRAYILAEGKFVMSGPAAAIAADPALKRAYLGM